MCGCVRVGEGQTRKERENRREMCVTKCVCSTHKMCLCTFLRNSEQYGDRPIFRKLVFLRHFAVFCVRLQALGKQLELRTL